MEIYDDDLELIAAKPYLAAQARSQTLRQPPASQGKNRLVGFPTGGVSTPQPEQNYQQPAGPRPDYRSMALDRAQQANEAATTMPDMGEQVQRYRQGYEAAGPDMAVGMLMGQLGGQMGREAGGQVLRQALANRQKQQTPYGTLDYEGGFTADPMKARDFRVSRLETQARLYETMAHNAETTEQRAAATKAANDTRREIEQARREDRAEARKDRFALAQIAGGRADSRRDEARAAGVDRVGGQVMDDYVKSVKDERVVLSAFDNLKATAQKTDAASDIAFIFQYMKMLDPNSVVREGEFATAQNATGIPDQVRNLYNRAMNGTRLNDRQRTDFLGTAGRIATTAEARMEQRRKEHESRLRAVGADPTIYLPGYRAPAAPAAPGGGGVIDFGQLPSSRR